MNRFAKRLGCRLLLTIIAVMVILLALTWLYSERTADRSILTDSPCAAPCWHGIVPGTRMEKEEILQILATLPNFDHVWEPTGGTIAWHWKQWPWRRTGYNTIYLSGPVVHNVSLSIDFELTVEEILDKYGLPEATNYGQAGVPEHPYVRMNLYYPTRGLQFTAMVLPWNDPVLKPITRIFEATYTAPAESLESWDESFDFDIHLQPWPGYGKLNVPRD